MCSEMKYLFSIQFEYLNKGRICVSLCLRVPVVNSELLFFPVSYKHQKVK